MMNCIAIDDEPLALDLLEDNIKRIPFLRLLKRCNNAFEATEVLMKEQIDLVFVDIQMPGITGLQFISTLQNKPLVIFVTAYKNFAVDGFELDAVDYLVKPVSFERFVKASNKAFEMFEMRQKMTESRIEKSPDHAFVYSEYSLVRINFNEITHVEGLKDYVKIHMTSQPRPLLTRQSLKGMEGILPGNQFVRIHKSFIVNTQKINAVRRNLLQVGTFEIPFSDSYKEELGRFLPDIRGI
jgi:DNA-binding LytR/AlgR family response regulator